MTTENRPQNEIREQHMAEDELREEELHQVHGGVSAGGIRRSFDDAIKDLEAQDRLGNFEIQRLMSRLNQSETLASNVRKKRDDTRNSVIGKI